VRSLEDRLEAVLGARPVAWQRRPGGYTATERFTVTLADGRRVFVKHAVADYLANAVRDEYRFYADVEGPYLPRLVGWDETEGEWPLLVLEDLSEADWLPDWTPERIDVVRALLREVAATPRPGWARPARDVLGDDFFRRWESVAADPEPFFALGLCTRGWFETAYPELRDAAEAAPVDGDALLHLDVRSDNMCFRDGRVYLVDWNWVAVGNPDLDVAGWLPSLACEGGPQPHELLPDAGELASALAGFWAFSASLPPPPTAVPEVRELQRRQLVVALEWAAQELGLPVPSAGDRRTARARRP
jgi:hypothetical protein